MAESGDLLLEDAYEAEKVKSELRKLVYIDHSFIFVLFDNNAKTFIAMGAMKKPAGIEMSRDEL